MGGTATEEPVYEQTRYEVVDPVATTTLDRPKALNAWTDRMGAEVRHALAQPEALNVYDIGPARSAQPPSAVRITTSQGGIFQNTRSVNAARARPKSAADRMALVQTGS